MGADPSPATELSGEDAKRASRAVVRRPGPCTEVARSTVITGAPSSAPQSRRSFSSALSPRALEKE